MGEIAVGLTRGGMMRALMFVLVILLAASGCTEGDFESVATDICTSGERWNGVESHDPEMYPGRDCNDCHRREGEGPLYAALGTVMPTLHEQDDCRGVSGVSVVIIGADGAEVSVKTNGEGNFYFDSVSVAMPYTAKLIFEDGSERSMLTPQSDLICANCHTAEGASAAPGRLTAITAAP